MMRFLGLALVISRGAFAAIQVTSSQNINTWLRKASDNRAPIVSQRVFATGPEFPEQFFSQQLDHFSNDTNETFGQRYWVNSRYYTKGGPVIVLDGGETSGEGE